MISIPENIKFVLFLVDLVCLYILLIGSSWSVFFPKKRIWPPPKKASWQYFITWILFYIVFSLNFVILILDWNNWIFSHNYRFFIAIPFIILGSFLFLWGIVTLGTKNTSGIKNQFITLGPYRYTRNPQYLGDILLFLGLTILANSLYLLILHAILSFIFVITTWAEEKWLEEQYGEIYLKYKTQTQRFL